MASVQVSGVGGNPNKIMFYIGMLFVVLGSVIGGGMLVAAALYRELGMVLFALVFAAMFCGIGGFFAKLGHSALHADDEVVERGVPYLGKIFGYDYDYSVLMNGQPCVVLVVRYLMSGQVREARVRTGEVDETRYPIGATVAIKLKDGRAALVPGSVSDMRIEQEDDLMNPDFDATGLVHSIGVSCPNCGANIAVPVGKARFCPYCNSKVSLDDEGRLVG